MPRFYTQPFATAGDKTAIPDAIQPSGAVSYNQGFGFDYSRDQATDPLAKDVPREETNQLYFDVTDNLRFWQTQGAPAFVTSAENGGSPLAYSIGAVVRWRASPGDPYRTYVSRIDSNTTDPSNATNWQLFNYQFAINTDTVSTGVPVDPAYVTARLAGVTVTVPDASTTVKGIVELATNAETIALSDAVRAVTPAGLGAAETSRGWVTPQATTAVVGKTRYATGAEALAGAVTDAAVTPSALAAGVPAATTSVAGRSRYATPTETTNQSAVAAAVTPDALTGYARLNQSVSFSNVSSSGGFDVTSSERVKTDLRGNPYGLNEVLRISTCVGRYRKDYNNDPREQVFLIAENLANIVPLAVRDGLANYNGEPIPTVNYDMMVPVLVRALQQEHAQRRAGQKFVRVLAFGSFALSVITACAYFFGG
jgi:hypothetical protein